MSHYLMVAILPFLLLGRLDGQTRTDAPSFPDPVNPPGIAAQLAAQGVKLDTLVGDVAELKTGVKRMSADIVRLNTFALIFGIFFTAVFAPLTVAGVVGLVKMFLPKLAHQQAL